MAAMAIALEPELSGIERFAESLAGDDRLIHLERFPARPARFADLDRPLPPEVWAALGVSRLWSHQATAIDLARDGRSVAVATGTASGKSLCFQAPIAEAVTQGVRTSTALLLFPTKALAQDQLRALCQMNLPRLTPATYDGDATPEARTWARTNANVVLTNPEMLHVGVLPHHARWATFLKRLNFVVVDELHMLRGIFGSHVANLLRRLRRVCAHYGSDPTFIFSSATIGSPAVLASDLCGRPVAEITEDGSPRGERIFVLWNPSSDDAARATSANRQTARMVADLVKLGHRTIAFCRSRKGTELVAADARRQLPDDLSSKVRPYRGGYLATERRDIELELFDGHLRGVIATNALELGVDIGGLDACVLNGFPGTIASMWQQAGRAGREAQSSIATLVAGDDQLDQWLMAHPTEVFTRKPERAVVNPANNFVLLPHLACAAYELPLRHQDERWWPDLLDEGVRQLVLDDRLRLRPGPDGPHNAVAVWAARGWPARGVGLRSGSDDEFRIAHPDGTVVGTVEFGRAFRLVHPGAIYLHQGVAFRVTELDVDDRVAYIEAADGSEYTQPRVDTDISLLHEDDRRQVGRSMLGLGPVRVRSRVSGYKRFDVFTGELLSVEELFLPHTELETRAFWYVVGGEVLHDAGVAPAAVPGTLHAVEHAAIGILPLFTICDRSDVGGVSTPGLSETGAPTIVIYDGYPGGAGVAELGFAAGGEHLAATLDVVESCRCTDGCPSCVQSPKCGNGNEPLDKGGAIALLRMLLG